MWTATLDRKDSTAKGGFARATIAKDRDRATVDGALHEAAAAHATTEGHTLGGAMTFPGATWVYCDCGAAFHSAGR